MNENTKQYYTASEADLIDYIKEQGGTIVEQTNFLDIERRLGSYPEPHSGTFDLYYDGNGNEISENEYYSFQDCYFEVDDNSNYHFYDADGNEISEEEYDRQNDSQEEPIELEHHFLLDEKARDIIELLTDLPIVYLPEMGIYMWPRKCTSMGTEDMPVRIWYDKNRIVYHKNILYGDLDYQMYPDAIRLPADK